MTNQFKPMDVRDIDPELNLIESSEDSARWLTVSEKPATLAVQDNGLEALCDDAALSQGFGSERSVEVMRALYPEGTVSNQPYFTILN